jgi:hypothetical protein
MFKFLIFSFLFLIIGCTPYKMVNINTLQPAQINLHQEIKNVIVANRYFPVNMDDIEKISKLDTLPDSISTLQIASHNCLLNFLDVISQSERFEKIIPVKIEFKENESIYHRKTQKYCSENKTDILLLIDYFYYQPLFAQSYPRNNNGIENFSEKENNLILVDLRLNITLQILFPDDSSKNQSIKIFETYSDLANKYHSKSKPTTEEGFAILASSLAGQYFGELITPYWKNESRYLFTRGSDIIEQSAKLILKNEIDSAIKLLLKIENSENSTISYRAKMNLAYCYEVKDIIWKARKFALEAYRINETPEAMELANRLYERDLENKKLDEQME